MNSQFEKIAEGLADNGYAVVDQFLSPEEVTGLLQLDEFQTGLLQFRKAGIGKATGHKINEQIRGDLVQWIDRHSARPEVRVYLGRLEEMITYLNESLYLSLKDFEVHFTIYPVGSSYQRHLDQFKRDDHRRLSVILYLNKDWMEEHGGQLRMHLPEGSADFFPLAGRLICFRSDQVEHEVRPATRERLSITGWILDQFVELKHL